MISVRSGAYQHYRNYVSNKYDDEPDSSDESSSEKSNQDYRYSDTEDATLAGLTQNMSGLQIGREYRRFGYFCCPDCNKTWQSAQAFCIYTRTPDKKDKKGRIIKRGEAVFEPSPNSKQACSRCNVMTSPYRTAKLRIPALGIGALSKDKAHR